MSQNKSPCELVVIGAGLSGSLLTTRLIDALVADGAGAGTPPHIVMLDRDGAFGGGVPYGDRHTAPHFLLLESVASSTPPEFQQWFQARGERILDELAASPDGVLRAWVTENRARVAAGRLDEVHIPRRVFGRFAREQLEQAVMRAHQTRAARITLLKGEARGLAAGLRDAEFSVAVEQGATLRSRYVVLAPGCIPRARAPQITGYLHDLRDCGFDAVRVMLAQRAGELGRTLDVIVIGAAATASELLYFLAHATERDRLRDLRVISSSGHLPGGALSAPDAVPVARASRPAAPEYVAAARDLASCSLLRIELGEVGATPRLADDGRLQVEVHAAGAITTRSADVVINCTGSGNVTRSSSPLLSGLAAHGPLRVNALDAGFEVSGPANEAVGAPGVFVIGPLLNREALETHVESIMGVYRAVPPLAAELHARLRRTATAFASSP
jgi:uncharacterized NAD(P)/FAD-binding protein YdhS